jgi:hypothetical protein
LRLPQPRGPLSHALVAALRDEADVPSRAVAADEDDLQLSLWMLYELHYRGFDDVDPAKEWDPPLLAVRRELEERFEADLRTRAGGLVEKAKQEADGVVAQLQWLADQDGAGMPAYLHRQATREQWEEFLALRSVYHLKESDPHAWVVPRVTAGVKASLVELQYDEFGDGRGDRVHQELFGLAMRDAGLDDAYGAYVDDAPAHVLAVSNAMSLFGLHRRLRGAALGHLAAFEMTSSLPCRRYAQGAARLGLEGARLYYEEHVEADAVHEQLAARSICGALVADEPALLDDVLLGAAACLALEHDSAARTLEDWAQGGSGLRRHDGLAVA